MICPNCGKLIASDEKICKLCGMPTKVSADDQNASRKAAAPAAEADDTAVYYMPGRSSARVNPEKERIAHEKETDGQRKKRLLIVTIIAAITVVAVPPPKKAKTDKQKHKKLLHKIQMADIIGA